METTFGTKRRKLHCEQLPRNFRTGTQLRSASQESPALLPGKVSSMETSEMTRGDVLGSRRSCSLPVLWTRGWGFLQVLSNSQLFEASLVVSLTMLLPYKDIRLLIYLFPVIPWTREPIAERLSSRTPYFVFYLGLAMCTGLLLGRCGVAGSHVEVTNLYPKPKATSSLHFCKQLIVSQVSGDTGP